MAQLTQEQVNQQARDERAALEKDQKQLRADAAKKVADAKAGRSTPPPAAASPAAVPSAASPETAVVDPLTAGGDAK